MLKPTFKNTIIKLSKNHSIWVLIVWNLALLIFFYQKVLFNPNEYLFANSGDGIKNYYVLSYHVQHDSNAHFFEGMNYPYGELQVYTDGQPALSFILKILSNYFPVISNYIIGIINILMLLSIFFCSFFLYKIFKYYGISAIYSLFFATGIAFLSPQTSRMFGHYSLSFSFFIPMIFYFFLLFYSSNKYKLFWSILCFFGLLFFLFTHPYLGVIVASFIAIIWCFIFIQNKNKWRNKIKYWLYAFLQIGLAIVVFYTYVKFLDDKIDRPISPGNMFEKHANFFTLFIPSKHFLTKFYNVNTDFKQYNYNWESQSFLGSVVILMLLYFLLRFLYSIPKLKFHRKKLFHFFHSSSIPMLNFALGSSLILLLLSMALPFRWGMEFILDWIPIIKQFRAIGRFSWVFFYIINIFCFYFLFLKYRYLRKKKLKKTSYALIFSAISLLYFDAYFWHQESEAKISNRPNLFLKKNLSDSHLEVLNQINANNYQAIIQLPYYYLSINHQKNGTPKVLEASMLFSFHSGLPLMNSYLARASTNEAKSLIQIFSPNFISKKIKNDIKDNRPILICCTHEKLTISEEKILKKANKVFENKDFQLFEISPENLFKNDASEYWDSYQKQKLNLHSKENFLINQTNSFFIYENFDSLNSEIAYKGKTAFNGNLKEISKILKVNKNNLDSNQNYILSFWYYTKGERQTHIFGILDERNDKNKTLKWTTNDARNSQIIDEDWSLIEMEFNPMDASKIIYFLIKANRDMDRDFWISHVLFRPKDCSIYKETKIKGKEYLYYNNLFIPKPK